MQTVRDGNNETLRVRLAFDGCALLCRHQRTGIHRQLTTADGAIRDKLPIDAR